MNTDCNTRLDQLEARLRRQQWLSLISLVLAVAAIGWTVMNRGGAAGGGTTVEANRFVLRDAKGEQRGVWEVDTQDDAYLRVAHEGAPGAFLGEGPEGPAVTLFSDQTESRIVLQAQPDNAQLLLSGEQGVSSMLATSGGGRLLLQNGNSSLETAAQPAGPWLAMGKAARPRITLGIPANGPLEWRLNFMNPDGTIFHQMPPTAPPP